MPPTSPLAVLAELAAPTEGAFRGTAAVGSGVSRDQLAYLCARGVAARLLPDTYRLVAAPERATQRLHAALLWAGDDAAAAGRSAGAAYAFESVRAPKPEIVVSRRRNPRHPDVDTFSSRDPASLMLRTHRGIRVTGPEATIVRLAHLLDEEGFEIACEDARRRRLTSVPALRSYLDRFGRPGRPGVAATRALLRERDPTHPAPSTREVKTRRLLVAHGLTDFVRESGSTSTDSTSRSSRAARSSRRTAGAGTTTRAITSTTTKRGAFPVATASSSSLPPGTRSRAAPTSSSTRSARRSRRRL